MSDAEHSPQQTEIKPLKKRIGSQARVKWLLGMGFVVIITAVLLPALPLHQKEGRRFECMNKLKMIGLALRSYHSDYGCFPPAYVADADGRPMHSWRVLLLPYLDQMPLYRQYRFDEPWNGPNNGKLAETVGTVYRCPSDEVSTASPEENMTSYVAVVGPETAWPGESSVRISDVQDETEYTLLVVEVASSGIKWMEPRDLEFRKMAPTINSTSANGISSRHTGFAWGITADYRVRHLRATFPAATVRALLTIRGGEKVSKDDL